MSVTPSAPPSRARATIRDVAALAGVGIKTVSRVINNEANVSPQMRERVQRGHHDAQLQAATRGPAPCVGETGRRSPLASSSTPWTTHFRPLSTVLSRA